MSHALSICASSSNWLAQPGDILKSKRPDQELFSCCLKRNLPGLILFPISSLGDESDLRCSRWLVDSSRPSDSLVLVGSFITRLLTKTIRRSPLTLSLGSKRRRTNPTQSLCLTVCPLKRRSSPSSSSVSRSQRLDSCVSLGARSSSLAAEADSHLVEGYRSLCPHTEHSSGHMFHPSSHRVGWHHLSSTDSDRHHHWAVSRRKVSR